MLHYNYNTTVPSATVTKYPWQIRIATSTDASVPTDYPWGLGAGLMPPTVTNASFGDSVLPVLTSLERAKHAELLRKTAILGPKKSRWSR